MGVLNITPDSFSDGGLFLQTNSAIKYANELKIQGADIIDIGSESTRPGAKSISEQEEMDRVLPVIEGLVNKIDVALPVDTYKAFVAEEAL